MCSVQFCPVGDTVKAMVDAEAPVSSQERAAEETALLGLFCNLYSLIAALRVVALLKTHTDEKAHSNMSAAKTPVHDTAQTPHTIANTRSFITIKFPLFCILTSFLSIFALMSLARFKKACRQKQGNK